MADGDVCPDSQVAEQSIPWTLASADDFSNVDFAAPISGSTASDCDELSERFREALNACSDKESAEFRVFSMLHAITGMYFRSENKNEPFGPMFESPNGRTAIPADFRDKTDLLAGLVGEIQNPVLKARFADVAALLDRKRGQIGLVALSTYCDIVELIDAAKLKCRFDDIGNSRFHHIRDILRRALQLGRILGWDKEESLRARNLVAKFRIRAAEELRVPILFYWFAKLDVTFGITDPSNIAAEVEGFIAAVADSTDIDTLASLWKLAARAHHYAKQQEDNFRCRSEAAECLVNQAMGMHKNSAMIAAHDLSKAIAELHGISGKRARRTELRHLLIEVQSRVGEEMSSFSHQMDLGDIIKELEDAFRGRSLSEMLFTLAIIDPPPIPDDLAEEAVKSIRDHPLSSLFGATHLDSEGKVIHRTEGAGIGDNKNDSAIRRQIFQSESIRRNIVVNTTFEVARRHILDTHFLSEDVFVSLLQHSPFVPPDLLFTFSRGCLRLFQGDFTSALYILTPLLENSLRYVLRNHGEDVTIFDDANQTQQDRTISSLFEQMRSSLDAIFSARVTSDIERVFLQKPGPYIRHALAHGLLSDGDPNGPDAIYGCWLIFKLCLIPLLPYRDQIHLPA